MLKLKSFLALAFSTMLVVSLVSSCGKAIGNSSSGPASPEAEKQTLRWAISPDYPPFEYYSSSGTDKKIIGFDVDVINLVSQELDVKIEMKEQDFNGIVASLQAKRADFTMSMVPTPERRKNVDFSEIYHEGKSAILALKGSKLSSLEDLAGKKVGVQLGTTSETALKQVSTQLSGLAIISLNKTPELIETLKTKRVDAVLMGDVPALESLKTNPGLEATIISLEGADANYAAGFPKGSPWTDKFNQVFKKLRESGELDKLAGKWFTPQQ